MAILACYLLHRELAVHLSTPAWGQRPCFQRLGKRKDRWPCPQDRRVTPQQCLHNANNLCHTLDSAATHLTSQFPACLAHTATPKCLFTPWGHSSLQGTAEDGTGSAHTSCTPTMGLHLLLVLKCPHAPEPNTPPALIRVSEDGHQRLAGPQLPA